MVGGLDKLDRGVDRVGSSVLSRVRGVWIAAEDTETMKYVAEHKCSECGEILSNRERCSSDGVCPHCGHVSEGVICETEKSAKLLGSENIRVDES